MIYDKLELLKMGITEESIQKQRDRLKDCIISATTKEVHAIYSKTWLPFIIDMLDDHKVSIEPHYMPNRVKVMITL